MGKVRDAFEREVASMLDTTTKFINEHAPATDGHEHIFERFNYWEDDVVAYRCTNTNCDRKLFEVDPESLEED